MSGFINSKEVFIDFKITASGEDKLSNDSFNPVFYTFDDSDVFYEDKFIEGKTHRVIDKTNQLSSFENNKNFGLEVNPKFVFDNVLKSSNTPNPAVLQNIETKKTVSDIIIEKSFIGEKVIQNKTFSNNKINFSKIKESSNFNFSNISFKRRYPTTFTLRESFIKLPTIRNDTRFSEKTKNKKLVPKGVNIIEEENNLFVEKPLQIESIFKNYVNVDLKILKDDDRKEVISKVARALEKDSAVYSLNYIINETDVDDSPFIFELHSVSGEESNENLEKLAFVHLDEFIDSKTKKQKNVFLIGKILFNRNKIEEISANKEITFEISNSYSFVNIFTLVVE